MISIPFVHNTGFGFDTGGAVVDTIAGMAGYRLELRGFNLSINKAAGATGTCLFNINGFDSTLPAGFTSAGGLSYVFWPDVNGSNQISANFDEGVLVTSAAPASLLPTPYDITFITQGTSADGVSATLSYWGRYIPVEE